MSDTAPMSQEEILAAINKEADEIAATWEGLDMAEPGNTVQEWDMGDDQ